MQVEPSTADGKTPLNRWETLLAYLSSTRLQQSSIPTVRELIETLWTSVGLPLTWAQVETLAQRPLPAELKQWQWWLSWVSLRAFLARQAQQRQRWLTDVMAEQVSATTGTGGR